MQTLSEGEFQRLSAEYQAQLQAQAQPFFIVIGGGPGAGKSTFFHAKAELFCVDVTSALYHNPDDLMIRLEGYQQTLRETGATAETAFFDWELPAREAAEAILAQAMDARYHIIYDRSCALPCAQITLEKAKDYGYSILFYGLYCDLSIAQARALTREKSEGRHIPPSVVQERHLSFYQLLPRYFSIADEAFLYNGGVNHWPLIAQKDQYNGFYISDQHLFDVIWPSDY